MKEHRITVGEFNERIGFSRSRPDVYYWLTARGAPSPENRERIARGTGLPLEAVTPRNANGHDGPAPISAAHAATIHAMHAGPSVGGARGGARIGAGRTPDATQFMFTLDSTGSARVRLDVTLPLLRAMPLADFLMRMFSDLHVDVMPDTDSASDEATDSAAAVINDDITESMGA